MRLSYKFKVIYFNLFPDQVAEAVKTVLVGTFLKYLPTSLRSVCETGELLQKYG